MNRLAFLLVPAVALVASLAPARHDDSADRAGRVRFSHQRHDRWLPACEFCHRRLAPDAEGNPTPWLEFARPAEASCICHRLPAAAAPARDPSAVDSPFAPPPPPAGTLEAGTKQAAAAVPHTTRGREDCLLCHALDGISPFPADHAGFGNQTCTGCHQPQRPPRPEGPSLEDRPSTAPPPRAVPFIEVPTPTTFVTSPLSEEPPDEITLGTDDVPATRDEGRSSAAPLPHPVEGMEDCAACHAAGGPRPWPTDHEGRTNDTCTACHAPPVATPTPPAEAPPPPPPPPPATFVPHVVDGLGDCTSCHRTRGLRPIPSDHDGYANDTCTACHVVVPRPPSVAAREGPDDPVCALCHPVDEQQRLALPSLVAPPERALVFSHAAHDAAAPASCDTCHSPAQADAGRPPSMQVCQSCHQDAMTRCARCHLADARGRLVTELPDGRRLVPPAWWGAVAHLEEWDTQHGIAARSDETMCRNCHEQPFCEGCHLGLSTERRFHGAGWLTLHGPAGRSSDLTCETCHDRQGTCLACHRRAGVAADSPDNTVPAGAGRYHPADWTFSTAGHPREARRNLGACVSCHSEGYCFTCHRGINPHGDSFFGGPCNAIRRANRDLCLECHATVPRCDD